MFHNIVPQSGIQALAITPNTPCKILNLKTKIPHRSSNNALI